MKKLFYTFLGMTLMFAGTVYALPYFTSQGTIIPNSNTQDLGTTTAQTGQGTNWRTLYVTQVCLSADTCRTTWPTGGGGGTGTVSTSTNETQGYLPYWTSNSGTPATLGKVATTSVTAGSGVSFATFSAIGNSPITIDCTGCSGTPVPNVLYTTLSGTRFYIASTSATDNLSWFFRNGFTSNASSTFAASTYFPYLTGGFAGIGSDGRLFSFSTSTIKTSQLTNDAGFGTGSLTALTIGAGHVNNGSVITTTGTVTGAIATSATPSLSGLAYWTGVGTAALPASLGTVATGTVSAGSTAITVTAGRSVLGGSLAIDCATASGSQAGCLSSADWSTFNGKLTSLDNFTHPATGQSATTSLMLFNGQASSTLFSSSRAWFNSFDATSTTATSTVTNAFVAGTNALVVQSSSGNVGINTSNPSFSLDITGATNSSVRVTGAGNSLLLTGSDPYIKIHGTGTNVPDYQMGVIAGTLPQVFVGSINSVPLTFYVNNGEKGRFDTSGNFLVGTTTGNYGITGYSVLSPQLSLSEGAGISQWTERIIGGNHYFATTTTQGIATSTVPYLTINSNGYLGIASSTPGSLFSINKVVNFDPATTSFSSIGGINIADGCFSVKGTCVGSVSGGSGTVTNITEGSGLLNQGTSITTTGTITGAIATSATPVLGNVAYWTGVGSASVPASLGTVATTSVTAGSGVSFTSFNVFGSTPITISNSNEKWATSTDGYTIYPTGQMGIFGTTTARIFPLTLASSTVPQLGLGDGTAGDMLWTVRNAGGNLYFSTTTTQGLATTSTAALTLNGSGIPSMTIGTSTCAITLKNGSLCLGGGGDAQGQTGTTTINMAKIQFEGMNNTGGHICAYFVGTTLTAQNGACTP